MGSTIHILPAESAPAGGSAAPSADLAHITLFSIRAARARLTFAMIAKDFPFVKDLQRINCESFVIMKFCLTNSSPSARQPFRLPGLSGVPAAQIHDRGVFSSYQREILRDHEIFRITLPDSQ